MSDPHGAPSKNPNDASRASPSHHGHDEEDLVKTPAWLPFLGIGLLAAGAMATYLWIYPGTMSPSTAGDGGADDAAVEGGALPVAPPTPQPLPGAQAVRPGTPSPMPVQVAPQR